MKKPDDKGLFRPHKRFGLYTKGGVLPLNVFKHRKDMNIYICIREAFPKISMYCYRVVSWTCFK